MSIKIEMEGDGLSFDRRIPMGVAVQIVQLVEEEEFEIEQDAVSDEKTEPSADEEETDPSGDEEDNGGVQGWR